MAILSFSLFYEAEVEKNRKQLLLGKKWSNFDENQQKASLYQSKGDDCAKFIINFYIKKARGKMTGN